MSTRDSDRAATSLLTAALAAVVLHITGSIVGGIAAAANEPDTFDLERVRVGQVLQTFGAAGSVTDLLLLVLAVGLVWWRRRHGDARAWPIVATRLLLVVVAVLVVVGCTGLVMTQSAFPVRASLPGISVSVGSSLGDLLLAAGTMLALGHVVTPAEADGDDLLLFAVDRVDGEVFAFLSRADAVRTLSLYSIEDDEFDFYDVTGARVTAGVTDGLVELTVTNEDGRSELLTRLRTFAEAHGLRVDATATADPSHYVAEVREWQWLQLWPGWLRPLGRVVRAMSGGRSR